MFSRPRNKTMTTVSFATNESTSARVYTTRVFNARERERRWERRGGGRGFFPFSNRARRFALLVRDAFTIVFLNESSRKCGRASRRRKGERKGAGIVGHVGEGGLKGLSYSAFHCYRSWYHRRFLPAWNFMPFIAKVSNLPSARELFNPAYLARADESRPLMVQNRGG